MKTYEKRVKVLNGFIQEELELDFGPHWETMSIPKNSRLVKELKLKPGDNIYATFRRDSK